MDKVRFLSPVFLGDTVTVHYEIASINLQRRRSVAKVEVNNQNGALVAVADHILQWVPNTAKS
jgi:acyl dehydratase